MRGISLALCGLLLVAAAPAAARADGTPVSPVGRWRTIDDDTGRPKSLVRLWEKRGVIYGTIEVVFPEPGKPPHPLCEKCEGALKNKPVEGMTFMWGLEADDDEWSGGRVVDPENGKVYRCTIKVVERGARLKVRGYVGISLLGRTQMWEHVPDAPPLTN